MYNGTQLYEKKILIVDDDFGLNQTIKTILSNNGFKYLSSAYSIEEATELLSFMEFSLILLDVMLPDGEGYQLAKYVRKDLDIPIIFLTAKNNPEDEIEGFVSGGDDYITKPFLPKNLVYRVIALLNRVYKNSVDTIHLDKNTYIDLANALVIKKNEKISLTPTELRIIEKLIDNQNRILSNESLFDIIWGGNNIGYDKVLKVHIRHIREKIEDNPSQPIFLQTIRGLGYKLIIN
ncbi:response regulator transcription factor [Enterococcus cecorum]|uniref:Response regulator transcription factor n=1 Tax=Enterococcus cecorum TaxID=44008 RepID=A0AAW8TRG9_9ENTE|nr:response regulator transcription factor [Enterococcus cecorum]MDT2797825.1 response regulator transcription factor [Enterococcus cecorum]CAI3393540.1 response regulator transcription factor [Enterococcus cecorum]CAI3408741.1 response regulator transcription factor [Enterococcus cecorum]CAI3511459.1 response regulator transcription factor [Enterococcus cecorum]CAI3512330.1 response regulator transcription factor [Enterococcus cecorum]